MKRIDLVPIDGSWKYLEANGVPPANWLSPGYDDRGWIQGDPILHAGDVQIDLSTDTLPPGLGTSVVTVLNNSFEQGTLPPFPGYGAVEDWSSAG